MSKLTSEIVNECSFEEWDKAWKAQNKPWIVTATAAPTPGVAVRNKHGHYFKDVAHLNVVDVYRVLSLFSVVDPCLQHAIKKLLVAGGRGAGKSIEKDVQEAVDTLERWKAMRNEERNQDDYK